MYVPLFELAMCAREFLLQSGPKYSGFAGSDGSVLVVEKVGPSMNSGTIRAADVDWMSMYGEKEYIVLPTTFHHFKQWRAELIAKQFYVLVGSNVYSTSRYKSNVDVLRVHSDAVAGNVQPLYSKVPKGLISSTSTMASLLKVSSKSALSAHVSSNETIHNELEETKNEFEATIRVSEIEMKLPTKRSGPLVHGLRRTRKAELVNADVGDRTLRLSQNSPSLTEKRDGPSNLFRNVAVSRSVCSEDDCEFANADTEPVSHLHPDWVVHNKEHIKTYHRDC